MDLLNYEFLNQTSCEPNLDLFPEYQIQDATLNYYKTTYIAEKTDLDFEVEQHAMNDFKVSQKHALAFSIAASAINPMTLSTRLFYEAGGYLSGQLNDGFESSQIQYMNSLIIKDFASIYKHMFMLSCANSIKASIDLNSLELLGEEISQNSVVKALKYAFKFNVIAGVNIFANVASDQSLTHFYDDYFQNKTKIDSLDLKPKEFWNYRVPVTFLKRALKDFSGDFLELFFDKSNVLGYEFKLASFVSQVFTNFSLETIFNGVHYKYAVSSLVGAFAKYGTEAVATYHIKKTTFGAKFPNLSTFCVIALECTAMIFTRHPLRD